LGDSLSQISHFNNPTYGFTVSLKLPIRNHAAEADLSDALIARRHDQYQETKTAQIITLEVKNAVHQLEQAKLTVEAAKVSVDLAGKNLRAEERNTNSARRRHSSSSTRKRSWRWRSFPSPRHRRATKSPWPRSITPQENC
jgi:outer membrane protein TolC